MKFSVGDPVYVKSNNEEGVILEFIGDDMASVKVGKTTFHAYLSDLEHPYLRWFTQTKIVKPSKTDLSRILPEKKGNKASFLEPGIYLVFMPIFKFDGIDETLEKVKVFFYNETISAYHFNYHFQGKSGQFFELDSTMQVKTEFYLHDISFEDASQNPSFNYRFVDALNPKFDFDSQYILKPKRFFDNIHEVKYHNKPFFNVLLCEKVTEKVKIEVVKPTFSTVKKQTSSHFDFHKTLKNNIYEKDLHIEKLCPDNLNMGNNEILQIQLRECLKALELAIATHQSSLIFIHGIGKGVLKKEIHHILDQTKEVKRYVNEYDNRYGYGATKVEFQY